MKSDIFLIYESSKLIKAHFKDMFPWQDSANVKAMQSFQEKLPAFKVKAEFLKAIANNQV